MPCDPLLGHIQPTPQFLGPRSVLLESLSWYPWPPRLLGFAHRLTGLAGHVKAEDMLFCLAKGHVPPSQVPVQG